MTDREHEIAKKITGYLDQGADDLRPGLAYRLQRARAEALARLSDAKAVSASAVAPAYLAGTGTIAGGGRPFYVQGRFWLGVAIIAAGLFGAQQWRSYQLVKELVDIDAQILTSDLPIDAYVDRGFENWLKTSDSD